MTRLQSFFAEHETTDDTTTDYDYSLEDEESREPTHFTLPLVPILNDNESSLGTVNEPLTSSTVQYEIELNEYSFRQSNGTDSTSPAPSTVVIDLLNQQQQRETVKDRNELMNTTSVDLLTREEDEDEERSSDDPDENSDTPHRNDEDEKNINSSENDTTTAESLASLEQTETESPETTLPDSRDFSNSDDDDDNYSTTSREFVINKSEEEKSFNERTQAEKTISNRSDTTAIHLDDYFDSILLNDSLLIDGTSSYENATELDYDATTITAFSPAAPTDSEESTNGSNEKRVESTTDVDRMITSTADFQLFPLTTEANSRKVEEFTSRDNDFPYENRIIKDDKQISSSEKHEETNKFVYHHVPITESPLHEDVLATPTTVVRFPETPRNERVRFPDDPQLKIPLTMRFAWPRDNGFQQQQQPGSVMRFWQEQPLINDFKFFSRGNSRAPSGNFNRPMSYRRNYR